MKNIYITGATSFIGLNLIKELINKKYNIIAIIRKNSLKKNLLTSYDIEIIELDLSEIERLPELTNNRQGIFYHLAWDGTRGMTRDDKKLQKKNVEDSIKVLKVAKELQCNTFFTAGSQAEYGIKKYIVTEETKCNPNTEYGKAKLKFYKYAESFCQKNNIRLIEPRFFSLYGKDDFESTLILDALKKMKANEDIDLTECVQTWNFLNIKDAVNALIKLQESNASGIFNFGSKDTRKLKEFINEMYEITKSKSKLNFGNIPYGKNGIINVNPSILKLQNAISWKPLISFKDGIGEIIKD